MSEHSHPVIRVTHKLFPVGHFVISVLFIVSAFYVRRTMKADKAG